MVKVVWERLALDRHEEWALNIAIEYSFTHAQTYLAEIESAQENLSRHPLLGIIYTKTNRKSVRRLITPSGYSVYYSLDSASDPHEAVIFSVIRNHQE